MTSTSDGTAPSSQSRMHGLYDRVIAGLSHAFPRASHVYVARAPGRVNIIGEHTDYNGLPVLPMAIDRDIAVAYFAVETPDIELIGLDDIYPPTGFQMSADIPPETAGHWSNYARAAAQAVWRWADRTDRSFLPLRGLKGCVGGVIPAGAGLSSSSALVVAAALAIVRANRLPLGGIELAEILARGEHYVGTQGGGMDQAASILGQMGSALKIDFHPLRVSSVRLPAGFCTVVANSMVVASKSGEARDAFNTRVAECRIGLELLKQQTRHIAEMQDIRLLQDFVRMVPDWRDVLELLPNRPLGLAEAAASLGITQEQLTAKCLRSKRGGVIPAPTKGFEPKRRVRHVLTEAERVNHAERACEEQDARTLGRLMNESHISCADDYDISCPELDALVDCMSRHRALGARLTGAGFGGCAIALVSRDEAPALMDAVWDDYYLENLPKRGLKTPVIRNQALFVCEPASGAEVL